MLLFGFFIFPNACTKEYVQKDPVCFGRDIQPIITSNCTGSGCHNANDRAGERDYTTLDGILQDVQPGNYQRSSLYEVMIQLGGNVMPPKPADRLSVDQIRTVATWIEEGAGNDSCVASSCDTTGVMRYSLDIRPILQTNCVGSGCHGSSAPASGISYSTYSSTKPSAVNGSMLGSIQHKTAYSAMPKGGSKLSDCSIAKISKWIDSGAPNN